MGRGYQRGRGSGNRSTRGNGGRGGSSRKSSSKPSSTTTKKTLADHVFYVGSAKQASDFVTVSNYILNYIRINFEKGDDIATALESLEEFDFTPDAPVIKSSTATDEAKKAKENRQFDKEYEVEYAAHNNRVIKYKENKSAAAALLWKQCASLMKSKIQSRPNYDTEIKGDPIKLLEAIKQHALSYESTQYRMKTICDALKSVVNLKQREDESSIDYLKRYKAAWDVFYSHVGKNFCFPRVVEEDPYYATASTKLASTDLDVTKEGHQEIHELKKSTMDAFRGYLYLENADRARYGSILSGLDSQFSLENDQYPKTLVAAQNVMQNHTYDPEYKNRKKRKEDSQKGNKKSQNQEESGETPKLAMAQMKNVCWCCGKQHKLPDCPSKMTTPRDQWHINKAKDFKQVHAAMKEINTLLDNEISAQQQAQSQSGAASVSDITTGTTPSSSQNSTWHFFNLFNFNGMAMSSLEDSLLLDSGASDHMMKKRQWATSVEPLPKPETVRTNGGPVLLTEQGTFPNIGKAALDENSITNLLSLGVLSQRYRITMDTATDNAFLVHTPKGVIRFAKNKANLYVHVPTVDTSASDKQATKHAFLQTVEENKKLYTPREVDRAKKARDLIATLGSPSVADLKAAISMNAIADLPVTTSDVALAEKIYGPDLGSLKGKTTRRKPLPMVTDQIAIPEQLYEARSDLELCIDIMFVNNMPFFTTISRALYYRTAQFLPTRTTPDLYKAIDQVLRLYNSNGFHVSKVYCDNEWKPIMDPVKDDMNLDMEYSAPQAHVPEAERNNRTLKERTRAAYHRLPYAALPKAMMKVLVSEMARKLNYFPNKHGISQHYSPRQIVHRRGLNYKHHCQYAFGSYVQAHTEPKTTNTPAPRTMDAIYLRPIDNGHEVYNLATGQVVIRRNLTALPITPTVIAAVNAQAAKDKQQGLRIKTRSGHIIYDSSWTAGVDYEEGTESDEEDSDYEYESDSDSESDQDSTSDEEEDSHESGDEREAQEVLHSETAGVTFQDPVQEGLEVETVQDSEDEEEPPARVEPVRRSTRARQPRSILKPTMSGQTHETSVPQVHLTVPEEHAELYDEELAQVFVGLLTTGLDKLKKSVKQHPTQKDCHVVTYSLNKGIKKFKERGYDSAKSEMKQLHDRECWSPIKISSMTPSEKKKALESLIFLVEKKSGKIKARHCANGSKQREWMRSEEAASPTVMTESVLLTATIEAQEERDVATFDIPNAFIQTEVQPRDEQGDRIIMKIKGAMIDMLIDIDDSYEEYVAYERGERVLYVHIQRAIYGMLMSGLLFYKKFRASIEKIGYKVNPYDPCVANKMINGKQHTISWHVDDLKSSHVDPKVNDDFHKWLQAEYGAVKEVTATRGKKHVYLGMLLDFSTKGKVKIDMQDYVKDMIDDFPTKLEGKTSTPANEHLYDVSKGKKLSPLKAEAFHTYVAKALFLTMRARPDIRLVVAFLCTRVKEPTTYDWAKLVKLMNFLYVTKEDCLTLESDGKWELIWSIDAAFAVHPDMKSHSGMTMTMGKGSVLSLSRKQKLNTRSSTEAELVAVDDCMAMILWVKYFLEAQGYKSTARVLQDNESAMKLEKNGHKSMGQRSRHINIRYFFVTDQYLKGNIDIDYCPTDAIQGDYMSKPVQGTKFKVHREGILNL